MRLVRPALCAQHCAQSFDPQSRVGVVARLGKVQHHFADVFLVLVRIEADDVADEPAVDDDAHVHGVRLDIEGVDE